MRKVAKIIFAILILAIAGILVVFKYPVSAPAIPPSVFAPAGPATVEVQVSDVITGESRTPEAFAKLGGSLFKMVSLVHPAIVIRHPQGTVIWESGLSENVERQVSDAGWLLSLFPLRIGRALRKSEYAREPAKFYLVSHAHWDHVSGLADFPDAKLSLLPEEIAFVTGPAATVRHGIFPELMKQLQPRLATLEFKDVPYENFPRSLDLFGDGSLVAVPLPGHTPGSLGLFVNFPDGRRFLLIGDASWLLEANGDPAPRPLIAEWFSDNDANQARSTRERLRELIRHSPEIALVPSHDLAALQRLVPTLAR